MLNVTEFRTRELKLSIQYVKEALRVLLHTVLFQRSIGANVINPRAVWSEQFELSYVRMEDADISRLVEAKIRDFLDSFEKNRIKTHATLCLNFFTTKSKKPSVGST